jgi:predicted dehydrogenase
MIDDADARGIVLAVAMVRRFARTTRFLRALLDNRTFGSALRFRLVSGVGGVWPTKSSYLLDAEQCGGGVLMSNGVHDLDLLAALFGHPRTDTLAFFADTDFGRERRLESDALIRMVTTSGVPGEVELSRSRDLENGIWIEFERASVHSPLYGDELTVRLPDATPIRWSGMLHAPGEAGVRQDFNAMLTSQLEDFAAAVRGEKSPVVDGREGRRVIETITHCYANVQPLDLPWRQPVAVPELA